MRTAKTSFVALVAASAVAVPALAGSGPSGGGAAASAQPMPRSVSCFERCADLSASQPGSTIRVYGREFSGVATVVFTGKPGGADDVPVKPSKVRSRTVYATVPAKAVGGPLVLRTTDEVESAPTAPVEIDRGATKITASGTAPAVDARVDARRAFFGGKRPTALNYLVRGTTPVQVSVALVRAANETVVASWQPGLVDPGTVQRIRWDGIDATTRKAAARGRYEFRVYSAGGSSRAADTTQRPSAVSSFLFLDHRFPIRGRHEYGESAAAFGAGRGGRGHRGQDVFAKCGTPLVAARGGVVKFAGSDGRSGNYLIINGAGTGVDYAYMHLREPSAFKKGDRVSTGDPIGSVGRTGNATACLLHFEEWSAPGWYTGGRPLDPLADLRAWDQYS